MKTKQKHLINQQQTVETKKKKSALKETEYLLSIEGMRESIIKGMKTPIEECVTKLVW